MTPGGSPSRPIASQTIQRAEHDEDERVRERRQHLRAPPAEAALGRGRAVREPGREEGEAERERIREHVRRVGEQRQRPGRDARERLDAGEPEHEYEDERERPTLAELVPVGRRASHARDRSEAAECLAAGALETTPGKQHAARDCRREFSS